MNSELEPYLNTLARWYKSGLMSYDDILDIASHIYIDIEKKRVMKEIMREQENRIINIKLSDNDPFCSANERMYKNERQY